MNLLTFTCYHAVVPLTSTYWCSDDGQLCCSYFSAGWRSTNMAFWRMAASVKPATCCFSGYDWIPLGRGGPNWDMSTSAAVTVNRKIIVKAFVHLLIFLFSDIDAINIELSLFIRTIWVHVWTERFVLSVIQTTCPCCVDRNYVTLSRDPENREMKNKRFVCSLRCYNNWFLSLVPLVPITTTLQKRAEARTERLP